MNLQDIPITYSDTVEQQHLDSLGHMNVMWYTHFFDQATWAFLETIGLSKEYHQGGYGSFALEAHTCFLNELREGDNLSIFTRALGRNGKLFHFIHFMQRNKDKILSATIEILGIHVDLSTRKSAPMPTSILARWDEIITAHDSLDWDPPLSGSIDL